MEGGAFTKSTKSTRIQINQISLFYNERTRFDLTLLYISQHVGIRRNILSFNSFLIKDMQSYLSINL